jgi:dsDNA-specific endonuclease/ATPase MutS2
MTFSPGDAVHVAALGKGIVRDVRSRGRYRIEIKGRLLDVAGSQLTLSAPVRTPRRARSAAVAATPDRAAGRADAASPSLDLHEKTVHEGLEAFDAFMDTALLEGHAEVRIIHGRSHGRIKAAVHARLQRMSSIRAFELDPRNPGVTIVRL